MNKIKASSLDIIVTGNFKKPYYEIKYTQLSDNTCHIGYSSYNLENVMKWKEDCFTIVNIHELINRKNSLERQLENCRNNDPELQTELDDITERIEAITKEVKNIVVRPE